jgi:hypothetical protein
MRALDMLSGRSLSITALSHKTVYIYREIVFIVKRFDGELKGRERYAFGLIFFYPGQAGTKRRNTSSPAKDYFISSNAVNALYEDHK